jgi:hypothetical protein
VQPHSTALTTLEADAKLLLRACDGLVGSTVRTRLGEWQDSLIGEIRDRGFGSSRTSTPGRWNDRTVIDGPTVRGPVDARSHLAGDLFGGLQRRRALDLLL